MPSSSSRDIREDADGIYRIGPSDTFHRRPDDVDPAAWWGRMPWDLPEDLSHIILSET